MDIFDVSIGTRLDLEIVNNSNESMSKSYACQLIDIIDKENIIVPIPIQQTRVIFIPTNARMRITFIHPKHGLLCFYATVAKKGQQGNIAVLFLKIHGNFEKVQRRHYYRQDCSLKAKCCLIDAASNINDHDHKNTEPEYFEAVTKNISGGGACIMAKQNIDKNSLLDLELELSSGKSVKATCKIVRSTEIKKAKHSEYEFGLQFVHISQKDQDELIKYIFLQQKKQAKNSWLKT